MNDTRPDNGAERGVLASSFTWRIRKPIHFGWALMMVVGLAVAFAPFQLASMRMHKFCSGVAPGASLADVQALAAASGFEVTPLVDGRALVVDPPSFGRRTCELSFDARGLVAAK